MEGDTYPPGQILLDADSKRWKVLGINGEGEERAYMLSSLTPGDETTRAVRVLEIGQYYAPVASP